MRVSIISLSDPGLTDSDLQLLLDGLPSPSILLLEDIDVGGPTQSRATTEGMSREIMDKQPQSSLTLSGILNAIDGAVSPGGVIVIATTNKRGDLDQALIRPGRLSEDVEFKTCTRQQAEEMFTRFYNPKGPEYEDGLIELSRSFGEKLSGVVFSIADLQQFLLQHKSNPQEAFEKLSEWIDFKEGEQSR